MKRWTEIDATASEKEMQDLLYGLVRMLKPDLIVETGCYTGHVTQALGRACLANGSGKVVACDTDERMVNAAREGCQDLPVRVHHAKSLDLPELSQADLIFSDSDYQTRPPEIAAAKAGAVIVVHDTARESHRYDPTAPYLGDVVKQFGGLLFDAGRGFGIIVKE